MKRFFGLMVVDNINSNVEKKHYRGLLFGSFEG